MGEDTVARVAVDVPLPHLDHPFDYLVPERFDAVAVPGCRVRVRFAGRLAGGFLLERVTRTEHTGKLSPLARVVSAEPVLDPDVRRLARAVADRYAGTLADVLRLAIPPRHARVEAEPSARPADRPPAPPAPAPGWRDYPDGAAFLAALTDGGAPRAVWTAVPGTGWPDAVAEAVHASLAAGRGALVVVPDARDAALLGGALDQTTGADRYVTLTADLGPAERYRRWLAVRRGTVGAVLGTRAAMFAPVHQLGLVVIWDDGDDLHAEPHAPYPHAREVLLLRAHLAGAGALVGGHVRTAEGEWLLRTGWAQAIGAPREVVRSVAPRVQPAGDDDQLAVDPAARTARLPHLAWSAAQTALRGGAPVLAQVPRAGYQPRLSCARCGTRAGCRRCAGPLARPAAGPAACTWCGAPAADWACARCGGTELRAVVVGAGRTAEELGRAFPGTAVRLSTGGRVLPAVPAGPVLVVATPGAEPSADGGYGAVLLLDAWALLGRPDLRAAEEALRRWTAAAVLARPAAHGGRVIVVADGALLAVQALIRWDPAWFAERELADRQALRFPPAASLVAVSGPADAVADLLHVAELPAGVDILGPVPAGEETERVLLRTPRPAAAGLAAAVKAAAALRSARRAPVVRIQVDPRELG